VPNLPPDLRVDVVVVQNLPWAEWCARVVEVERLGYDGVHVWDHAVHRTITPDTPLFDGLTALATAAALTERVRLGTLVCAPVHRHPLALANIAVTLDHASGGRLDLGIGAGGAAMDFAAYGIEPWSPAELVRRFEDTVAVVDAVLRGARSVDGPVTTGEGVSVAPGPVQQPRPPLLLAARGDRSMRIVGRYADTWNVVSADLPPDDELARLRDRLAVLDRACEEAGRDPAEVRRSVLLGSRSWPALSSVAAFRDAVLRHVELGIDHVVLIHPGHPGEEAVGHGPSAPGLFRDLAEALPDLRAEVAG
jgi:alkanesulfonate monooxygenase SsuD/methylene tetrahydromethanopterin reductase-like flavin-dependent oxidoreductase (luciferase family)